MFSYTSSAMHTMPVGPLARTTAANASSSAAVATCPVGLCGVFMMTARVRGVTAAAKRARHGSSYAKRGGSSVMTTGVPPARRIAGRYHGKYGSKRITSSPGEISACIVT